MFKRLLAFVVSAVVIIGVVGIVVLQKESAYLEKNPFFLMPHHTYITISF